MKKVLPDSLIIGPMRTATTWVYEYLKARGDICLPKGVKETFFFDQRFEKGVVWYASHFKHFDPAKHTRVVEVAPSYFHAEEAPKRIREVLGTPRLIAIVRDPIERSISHYRHLRRRGLVTCSLREATKKFPEIVGASQYARCLQRWETVFGIGSVFLLYYDALLSNPQAFVSSLCQALAIPMLPIPQDLLQRKVNPAGDPPFPRLARLGLKLADLLRDHRLYGPIELAKRLGLKSLFFGSEHAPRKSAISPKDREFLRELLDEDWRKFKAKHENTLCDYSC